LQRVPNPFPARGFAKKLKGLLIFTNNENPNNKNALIAKIIKIFPSSIFNNYYFLQLNIRPESPQTIAATAHK